MAGKDAHANANSHVCEAIAAATKGRNTAQKNVSKPNAM